MATLDQIEQALIRADKAGDAEGAHILAAEVRRLRSNPSQEQAKQPLYKQETMQESLKHVLNETDWGTRNIAGFGTAASNLWEGAKQLVGNGDQERIKNNRVISESAPVGAIAGNIATYAPLAMVPGANTLLGGAALGGASGFLQPTVGGESRLTNTALGAGAGMAVPLAINTSKAIKAAVIDPFTVAGRNRMAGALLNRSAADPSAVSAKLMSAKGSTAGFTPTVGQAADDSGIASLERTMRAIDPRGFDAVDKSQRGALIDALRSVAQTPETRSAAVNAREAAVNPLYEAAKKAVVAGDSTMDDLLTRPSMQTAQARASNISAERGEKFMLSQATRAQTVPTGIIDAQGNPVTRNVPGMPAAYPGRALHDLKMGLDDAIGSPGIGGMQGAERNAALGTKSDYLNWLESKIPEYAQAKSTFSDMSKPINQMDIGQELFNRFTPALADQGGLPFKSTAQAYANALRNGDALAQNVTGMKAAKLESIMTPEQMQLLSGVAKDSALKAAAENAGRGAGSDTVQKIAMSNIAAQANIPNWISSMARVPGGWAKRAGDILYGNADEQVRQQLAHILTNPQEAAQAMNAAGANPSMIAEFLKTGAQGIGLSAMPSMLNR